MALKLRPTGLGSGIERTAQITSAATELSPSQGVDANPMRGHKRVAKNIQRVRAALECVEGGRDIFRSPDFG